MLAESLSSKKQNFLWLLMLCYSMFFVSANWFDPRLIHVFGITTGAGAIVFPLTYLLSDQITEIYGYKYARRAIWTGFFFNIIFLFYANIIAALPDSKSVNSDAFNLFIHTNTRIILASTASYLISEPFNSYIMAKLKIALNGKLMGLRFITSTFIASAIDTVIFCFCAFYGSMSDYNFFFFVFGSWCFMVTIEILLLPISVRLAKKIKTLECLDIYDKKTNFNIFSLETVYSEKDNQFKSTRNKTDYDAH